MNNLVFVWTLGDAIGYGIFALIILIIIICLIAEKVMNFINNIKKKKRGK